LNFSSPFIFLGDKNSLVYRIHRTGAITVPNLLQLSLPLAVEAPTGDSDPSGSSLDVRTEIGGYHDEEIGQSSACDWLDPPPLSGAFAMEETQHRIGDEGVMLEAFQQFQHNPQIQVRTDTMLTCTHIIEIMFVLTTFETTFCFKKST
jgi:hypothetical protein